MRFDIIYDSMLNDFQAVCNFGSRLRTLQGLTPCEYIRKTRTSELEKFIINWQNYVCDHP